MIFNQGYDEVLNINRFLIISDLMDDSAITLIQRFEEEQLLIKRESLELVKMIGQGTCPLKRLLIVIVNVKLYTT